MTAPRVLVANDQEWTARSLESVLQPLGYDVHRAYTGRQAIDVARRVRPQVVILDAQLPDLHGFDVCRVLRGDPLFGAHTAILVTTAGPAGRSAKLEALQAGAWDFLAQPLDLDQLLLKVRNYAAAGAAVQEMREHALLDPATGLYNRQGLERRMDEIARATYRRSSPITWAVMVPAVRDGDRVMTDEERRRMADRLGRLLNEVGRSTDVVARVDDTAFSVVAPGTSGVAARRMVERLRRAVAETDADGPGVSVLVGLGERSPVEGEVAPAVEQLLAEISGAARELAAVEAPDAERVVRIFAGPR